MVNSEVESNFYCSKKETSAYEPNQATMDNAVRTEDKDPFETVR